MLKNYNRYARPSTSYAIPTNVTFGLSLSQLIDVVSYTKANEYMLNHIKSDIDVEQNSGLGGT